LDCHVSRTGGCQYPNKIGVGYFIFAIAASFFPPYAPNCCNLPELTFACYMVFEKKSGPNLEGGSSWMHLLFDDYNVGHDE
jgi:hypothetical protein